MKPRLHRSLSPVGARLAIATISLLCLAAQVGWSDAATSGTQDTSKGTPALVKDAQASTALQQVHDLVAAVVNNPDVQVFVIDPSGGASMRVVLFGSVAKSDRQAIVTRVKDLLKAALPNAPDPVDKLSDKAAGDSGGGGSKDAADELALVTRVATAIITSKLGGDLDKVQVIVQARPKSKTGVTTASTTAPYTRPLIPAGRLAATPTPAPAVQTGLTVVGATPQADPPETAAPPEYFVLLTGTQAGKEVAAATTDGIETLIKRVLGNVNVHVVNATDPAPRATAPNALITAVWPLTFVHATVPSPPSPGSTPLHGDSSADAQTTGDAVSAFLQAVMADSVKVKASAHRLFITGTRARVQEARRYLAQYIDIPYSQVRLDIWTIQSNTKSTRGGRKERAQRKMNSIRAGVQVTRDLMSYLRQELIAFARGRERAGIESNLRDPGCYPTDLLRCGAGQHVVSLADLMKHSGFDPTVARPLTLAEAVVLLAFIDPRGGDQPFEAADVDPASLAAELARIVKEDDRLLGLAPNLNGEHGGARATAGKAVEAALRRYPTLRSYLAKYNDRTKPTDAQRDMMIGLLNDLRANSSSLFADSVFGDAADDNPALKARATESIASTPFPLCSAADRYREMQRVNKRLIEARFKIDSGRGIGARLRAHLAQAMKRYVDQAASEAEYAHIEGISDLLRRFRAVAETKEVTDDPGGGIFPRFVQAYSYSYGDVRQRADIRGIGDFFKYWVLVEPGSMERYVASAGTDIDLSSDDIPGHLAQASAEVDAMIQSLMGGLHADMQELCTQPLLEWIRDDIQGGDEGSSGIQMVGNTTLTVSSRLPASAIASAEAYFPFTPRPELTEAMLTDALNLSKGTAGTATGERIVTEKDGSPVRKANGDVLKLTPGQDVVRGADGQVLRDNSTGDPTVISLPAGASSLSIPTTVLGALNPAAALGVKMLFNTTQTVYNSVAPGISFGVAPFVLRDGGSARLAVNLVTNTSVNADQASIGTSKTNGPPVDLVRGHSLSTDVAVQALDLFELSTFANETTRPGEPQWRIPLLEQLPIVGPLFNGPPTHEAHHQESLILVYVTIVPRSLDLAGRFLQ